MKTINMFVAIACFALAVVIFVFASGGPRIYSGGFFALLGIITLVMGRSGKG